MLTLSKTCFVQTTVNLFEILPRAKIVVEHTYVIKVLSSFDHPLAVDIIGLYSLVNTLLKAQVNHFRNVATAWMSSTEGKFTRRK